MGALREYLGILLGVCLVVVPGLLLPRPLRSGLERVLREGLVMPGQTITSCVLLQARRLGGRDDRATVGAGEAAAHEAALQSRWQTVLPLPPGNGLRGTPRYRAAVELAMRERYEPLRRFVRAPVLSERDGQFSEGMRLGCGRGDGVEAGAPAVTAEGYLVGVVDEATRHTCRLSRLGSPGVRVYCDVWGSDEAQGILAGLWRGRPAAGGVPGVPGLELQIIGRGISVKAGDAVVTSSFAGGAGRQLPGGIPVGWVDGVETTEEGYTRARVRVHSPGSGEGSVYVMTVHPVTGTGPGVEAPDATQARCRAELRRVLTYERDLIPAVLRELAGGGPEAGADGQGMARIVFGIRQRDAASFYDWAEPAGWAALGLRPGLACLSNRALIGVTAQEGDALRVRLLTAPAMPVSVEVVQANGVRYRGLLAAAEGANSREPVPDGWSLPGQPRLQIVSLENEGLPVLLPAQVVTAAGGVVPVPPGIPVGELVGDQGDPFAPCWQVRPYANFGCLAFCTALVPTAAHAVSPSAGSAAETRAVTRRAGP